MISYVAGHRDSVNSFLITCATLQGGIRNALHGRVCTRLWRCAPRGRQTELLTDSWRLAEMEITDGVGSPDPNPEH